MMLMCTLLIITTITYTPHKHMGRIATTMISIVIIVSVWHDLVDAECSQM